MAHNTTPHEPTKANRDMISALIGCGLTLEQIATVIGISRNTLRKHYKGEIKTGYDRIYGQIAATLVQRAMSGDLTAIIFWLKTRAGWRTTQKVEFEDVNDPANLSDGELSERIAKIAAVRAATNGGLAIRGRSMEAGGED